MSGRVFLSILVLAAVVRGEEVSLFDGKTLEGWEGNRELWKVEEGAIVGTTTGLNYNTFLIHAETFGDFELRLKGKLDANNSGIQFRSKIVDPEMFVMSGYQADIAPNYWGLLYEEKGRGMLDFKKDVRNLAKLKEYNDYLIRAVGPDIHIYVNGELTVHYVEKDEAKEAKTGRIGLQLHAGPPMKVWFKDITLKRL